MQVLPQISPLATMPPTLADLDSLSEPFTPPTRPQSALSAASDTSHFALHDEGVGAPPPVDEPAPGTGPAAKENVAVNVNVNAFTALMEPAAKKARVSDAGEGSSSGMGASAKKGKAKAAPAAPKDWREVVLEGEE